MEIKPFSRNVWILICNANEEQNNLDWGISADIITSQKCAVWTSNCWCTLNSHNHNLIFYFGIFLSVVSSLQHSDQQIVRRCVRTCLCFHLFCDSPLEFVIFACWPNVKNENISENEIHIKTESEYTIFVCVLNMQCPTY